MTTPVRTEFHYICASVHERIVADYREESDPITLEKIRCLQHTYQIHREKRETREALLCALEQLNLAEAGCSDINEVNTMAKHINHPSLDDQDQQRKREKVFDWDHP